MLTKVQFDASSSKVMVVPSFYSAPGFRTPKYAKTFNPIAVNIANDTIQLLHHNIADETLIRFRSTGTLPAPLAEETDYYAIRVSGIRIKVAASSIDAEEGTAIDITTTGSGVHTLKLEAPIGFGTGTAYDPYRIRDFDDLCQMQPGGVSNRFTAYWELCDDIDASASVNLNNGFGWLPVGLPTSPFYTGSYGVPFSGHFDGNGQTISGLFMTKLPPPAQFPEPYDNNFRGFFGAIETGTVLNLGLIDIDIREGGMYIGGLCGVSRLGTVISGCYTTGEIGDYQYGQWSIGGLCGWNAAIIKNCWSSCSILTSGALVGGLCGNNTSADALIINCYATGSITASIYSTLGATGFGGLCGHNGSETFYGSYGGYSIIINCYSTGSIIQPANTHISGVGGLCGINGWFNGAFIRNCYSTGNVEGMAEVGGFCGVNQGIFYGLCFPANISNCYCSGNVTSTDYVGGFCGKSHQHVKIENCYSISEVTGETKVGGFCGELGIRYKVDIKNCYATGKVTGIDKVGGFCGYITGGSAGSKSTIINCYSIGEVTGDTNVGGFCGLVGDNYTTITSCYYNSDNTSQTDTGKGEPRTTAQMKQQATFVDWTFGTTMPDGNECQWRITEDVTYPWLYMFIGLRVRTRTSELMRLTSSSTDGGDVTVPGEGGYDYTLGEVVNLTATEDTNYHFVNWTGSAVTAGKVANPASAITTVTMDGDYTIIANFAIDVRQLTISSTEGGYVITPGEGVFEYEHGTAVYILASWGDDYWDWDHWSGTAVDAGKVVDPYARETTVFVDADYTLIANFVPH